MERLKQILQRLNGKGYKAYKDIQGTYEAEGMKLHIDYVQGDPFASPSRIRVEIPAKRVGVQEDWLEPAWRRTAAADYLARCTAAAIGKQESRSRGTGKSGLIAIDKPGQEVLPRTAVRVDRDKVEVRLSVGLPAAGRSILAREAVHLLCELVPAAAREGLLNADRGKLQQHLQLADQQAAIRAYLKEHGYTAFVANGSILPRESGISSRPLKGSGVVPFESPASLEVEIELPHRGPVRGMALRQGVSLIVGGGYHGKSTLLKAIESGVYNHVAGDGREYVITDETAFKIRAEDGRRVEKVNISPFISNLPFGKDTARFSTEDASGSTSQAANIMEALEIGSKVLLIDEDTSATNFMIRDARMQRLVAKSKEPITPFVDKVRQLYDEHGVSTILVLGGSGDYFQAADTVIMMDEYRVLEVTEEARRIAGESDNGRRSEGGDRFGAVTARSVKPESLDASRGHKDKADAKGLSHILYGLHTIDLSLVEQLVDPSQTRAIVRLMQAYAKEKPSGSVSLSGMLDKLYARIEEQGLECISPYTGKHPGDLALPRRLETAAAINRLRGLRVQS
ncbi:ATPase [Paenibacillus sambharensis]|uniref:ATPase n=1 Tax=Paenibacillus sambharensis TaxID=1803190 RepID=A0A2W1LU89_9BACL|nr:ABC-ATPase domain-containing protein [Paenibacillus sambharensis]PZD95351.1 ATPase [Paenibacillus sambharensis]